MKNNVKLTLLCLAVVMVFAACGPADIGFSNVIIKNESEQAIVKIEIDSFEVKGSDGSSVNVDAAEGGNAGRVDLYLEFITDELHDVKATYADDKVEVITKSLSVNTSSTNTVTFGIEKSTLNFINDTDKTIFGIYFCEEKTSTPEDDFSFVKIPNLIGVSAGSSSTMELANEGSYYLYTLALEEEDYVYQGSVTLTYNSSVNFTASN